MQDTLLTIHRARASYNAARPFRPWLVAIAERRALDRVRARGRRAGREVAIDAAGEIASEERGAEAALDAQRASATLREAVQNLPASQRTALGTGRGLFCRSAQAVSRCWVLKGPDLKP